MLKPKLLFIIALFLLVLPISYGWTTYGSSALVSLNSTTEMDFYNSTAYFDFNYTGGSATMGYATIFSDNFDDGLASWTVIDATAKSQGQNVTIKNGSLRMLGTLPFPTIQKTVSSATRTLCSFWWNHPTTGTFEFATIFDESGAKVWGIRSASSSTNFAYYFGAWTAESIAFSQSGRDYIAFTVLPSGLAFYPNRQTALFTAGTTSFTKIGFGSPNSDVGSHYIDDFKCMDLATANTTANNVILPKVTLPSGNTAYCGISYTGAMPTCWVSADSGTTWVNATLTNKLVGTATTLWTNISIPQGSRVYGTVNITLTTSYQASPNMTLNAQDEFDGSSLSNLSATITNGVLYNNYSTMNGTILVTNLPENLLYNITVRSNDSGGYFNVIYPNINISQQTLTAKLYQALAYFNASQMTSGIQITSFGVTKNGTFNLNNSNSSGFAALHMKAGSYYFVGNSTGYFNTTINATFLALETKYLTLNFGNVRLRISAQDIFTNTSLSSFAAQINGINNNYANNLSTTTGNISVDLISGNYSLIEYSPNYAIGYANVSADTMYTNYSFNLYSINSVFINVFYEGTNTLITGNNTIKASFSSNVNVLNLSTNNGTIYAQNITPSLYSIDVSGSDFTTRTYLASLTPNTYIIINAYLGNATTETAITFTFKDAQKLTTISNISVSVSDRINLSYVTIDQAYSDIIGNALFYLDQTKIYRFTLTKDGYSTKVFDLNPVLTAYTINLDPTVSLDFSTIYSSVSYIFLPQTSLISTGTALNFSIITASLNGALQSYFGLNTTYLGVLYKTNVSGSPAGGTGSIILNLNNASFQNIDVTYFIKVDGKDLFLVNRNFYLSNVTASNMSVSGAAAQFKNNIGGGWLAIIAVFGTILIMGTFWGMGLSGNRLSIIGAFSIGIFTYFGFINADPWKNYIIGSVTMITLLGSYFILNRIGDT